MRDRVADSRRRRTRARTLVRLTNAEVYLDEHRALSGITLTNGSGLPTTGLTGTLQAGQFPTLTGDVTTTAGALGTTVGAIGGKSVALGAALTTTGAGAATLAFGSSTQTYTFPSGTFLSLGVPKPCLQLQTEAVSSSDRLYACTLNLSSAVAASPLCEVPSSPQ